MQTTFDELNGEISPDSRASSARTLHAEGAGLMDLLALLLVEATEAILRGGILADYVEREDELPALRGRILGDQQMLRRFGQIDRLICRFDEYEQDIVENQLLAAALGRYANGSSPSSATGQQPRPTPPSGFARTFSTGYISRG